MSPREETTRRLFPASWSSDWLALVDRQRALIELEDGQVARRRVHRADHRPLDFPSLGPAAVRLLEPTEPVEGPLAVVLPGDELVVPGLGEELLEAVVAQ